VEVRVAIDFEASGYNRGMAVQKAYVFHTDLHFVRTGVNNTQRSLRRAL
jgi:hypothetical protein